VAAAPSGQPQLGLSHRRAQGLERRERAAQPQVQVPVAELMSSAEVGSLLQHAGDRPRAQRVAELEAVAVKRRPGSALAGDVLGAHAHPLRLRDRSLAAEGEVHFRQLRGVSVDADHPVASGGDGDAGRLAGRFLQLSDDLLTGVDDPDAPGQLGRQDDARAEGPRGGEHPLAPPLQAHLEAGALHADRRPGRLRDRMVERVRVGLGERHQPVPVPVGEPAHAGKQVVGEQ
jgi:hypothetical protein